MLELKSHHFTGQLLSAFRTDVVIILYKAEWCHYCKQVKPEFEKLSKMLLNKAVVAVVDSDNSEALIHQNNQFIHGYKVDSFPTIVIYKNGKFVSEFHGPRTMIEMRDAVVKFL